MQYKGTIIFLRSARHLSVYNVKDKGRAHLFVNDANADVSDSEVKLAFNSGGYGYSIHFHLVSKNYYEGEIISENANWGSALLTMFKANEDLLCRISYTESGEHWDCFLNLSPSL